VENIIAAFTVRVVLDGDETKTQLVVHRNVVKETSPKPMSPTGLTDYLNIVTLVLNAFRKEV